MLIDHLALVDMSEGNKGVWQRDDLRGVQVDGAKADAANKWEGAYECPSGK